MYVCVCVSDVCLEREREREHVCLRRESMCVFEERECVFEESCPYLRRAAPSSFFGR